MRFVRRKPMIDTILQESAATRTQRYKAKVCLIGDASVGKTSLVRRYVLDEFDDRYLSTLGTKVSRKELRFDGNGTRMDLLIWDIMGQAGFRDMLKDAYFFDSRGALAVCDITRRTSLENLELWIRALESVAGRIPIVVAVNKSDLSDAAEFQAEDAHRLLAPFTEDVFLTSARVGDRVEDAFRTLGEKVLDRFRQAR